MNRRQLVREGLVWLSLAIILSLMLTSCSRAMSQEWKRNTGDWLSSMFVPSAGFIERSWFPNERDIYATLYAQRLLSLLDQKPRRLELRFSDVTYGSYEGAYYGWFLGDQDALARISTDETEAKPTSFRDLCFEAELKRELGYPSSELVTYCRQRLLSDHVNNPVDALVIANEFPHLVRNIDLTRIAQQTLSKAVSKLQEAKEMDFAAVVQASEASQYLFSTGLHLPNWLKGLLDKHAKEQGGFSPQPQTQMDPQFTYYVYRIYNLASWELPPGTNLVLEALPSSIDVYHYYPAPLSQSSRLSPCTALKALRIYKYVHGNLSESHRLLISKYYRLWTANPGSMYCTEAYCAAELMRITGQHLVPRIKVEIPTAMPKPRTVQDLARLAYTTRLLSWHGVSFGRSFITSAQQQISDWQHVSGGYGLGNKPTIAETYYAWVILDSLELDCEEQTVEWIKGQQQPNGLFVDFHTEADKERQYQSNYMALTILRKHGETVPNAAALRSSLISLQTEKGGFGLAGYPELALSWWIVSSLDILENSPTN